TESGILVNSGGGNFVVGNYVGTDVTGSTALANGTALHGDGAIKINNSPSNTIGGFTPLAGTGLGNVLSGNNAYGVYITGSIATGNKVQGNLIGLKANGLEALPNPSGSQLF